MLDQIVSCIVYGSVLKRVCKFFSYYFTLDLESCDQCI